MNKNKISTENLVLGAILTALVIILQLIGASIRLGPFSVSLVLIPIVIGAATCGVTVAAWLGLVFGSAVLLSGDAAAFLTVNALGTIIVVLFKGIAAGLGSGLLYKLFEKKNKYAAVFAAAFICPVANTGIFLLGCVFFFMETITGWAQAAGLGGNVAQYMIFVLVGTNFLFELGINMLLSPIVVRLIDVWQKNKTKRR